MNKIYSVFYIVVFLFVIKLIDIQILKHSYFLALSERNRLRIITRIGPRGEIITSDGISVAKNKRSYSVMYFPSSSFQEGYISKISYILSKITDFSQKRIEDILRESQKTQKPFKVLSNINVEQLKNIYEIKNIFPEIEVIEENMRFYPYKNMLSHIIGYVGKIDEVEVKDYLRKGYPLDAVVGKSGVEKKYEEYLRGRNGGLFMEVDSRGRLVRVIGFDEWIKGNDVFLTINFEVQKKAEEALFKLPYKRGAAIACEADSGRIVVYAVKPGFDPNIFVSSISSISEIDEFNIPVQGLYPPASTFKIITTIAALESEKINENARFYCPGYYDAGNRIFKCWVKKGHGLIDMFDGLANSCDVYYYNVGEIIGPYEIENTAKRFRLDQKTGIDMPYEKTSSIVGPKKRMGTRGYWYRGDTLNLSIGQGEVLVTPISMMMVMMALANGGRFYRPYYVDKIVGDGKTYIQNRPNVIGTVVLKPHTWEVIYKAMRKVITDGTGKICNISGVDVYGKTGTAQNPQGKDHAWFVCFAKKEGAKPLAVVVLIEHGEHGSSSAAPVAREIIKAYYRVDDKNLSIGMIE